jgi:hypothetical protein
LQKICKNLLEREAGSELNLGQAAALLYQIKGGWAVLPRRP